MGFIPEDAEWWIAETVEEFTIEGQTGNTVHRNFILIHARSADEAYRKALEFGRASESTYQNPDGNEVAARFRGIKSLDVIHDKLEDGAELLFYSDTNLSPEQVAALIPPKEKLQAFLPYDPAQG
jgi:hypothetical protein